MKLSQNFKEGLSKYRVQAILVLIAAGFIVLYFVSPHQTDKDVNVNEESAPADESLTINEPLVINETINETNEALVNTNQPDNIKTYTSSALGISFNYLGEINEVDGSKTRTKISEQGNKIYVYLDYDYRDDEKPEEGQWVEVFKKERADSLETAIKKQFLTGYSEKDCFVVASSTKETYDQDYSSGYVMAEISYPLPSDNNQEDPWWINAEKCPAVYTKSNGISYFLADENHSDKFLFVSVGQYIIPGLEEARGWEQTIRFIE